MIEHVRRRACLSRDVSDVYVATCDREIYDLVAHFGGKAILTSPSHERCTDRIEEAAKQVNADIIVNVQGDEPLLLPEVIGEVARPLAERSELPCTNLLSPLSGTGDLEDVNIVKAIVDKRKLVMSFLRWLKPYFEPTEDYPVYRQAGISAFQKPFLHKYSTLPQTPLERVESVDMLRVVEHGYQIQGVIFAQPTLGVDRPEDIGKVEAVLRDDTAQKAYYARIASL